MSDTENEMTEPAAAVATPVDTFAAVLTLLAAVADPKGCAARLAELRTEVATVEKARADLAAARERQSRDFAARRAKLDEREATLRAGEVALDKNMQRYRMRQTELDEEGRLIFKLAVNARRKGGYDQAFQERLILKGALINAAEALGAGMQGTIVYDSNEIGRWEYGPNSLVRLEAANGR
jgi:hypothetical protein